MEILWFIGLFMNRAEKTFTEKLAKIRLTRLVCASLGNLACLISVDIASILKHEENIGIDRETTRRKRNT
ncbi:hypothetical protein Y032_0023g691 [Ancylostoma ceylanicum]|uniref:Uncharacterized protein n=1 Tax=Ancylostoma ceylanicum TaxID=53326 RepID=A0A016UWD2_9BILA|nr:hypothetical protein Y032_0023g691 [Ancylostoma ceylanicum]